MAQKKEKKKRRAYLSDFTKTESGEYRYSGKVYVYDGKEDLGKLHKLTLFLTVTIMVSLVLAGLLPAKGIMDAWYVILPYLTAFANGCILCWKYGRYRFNAKELREYVYEKTVKEFSLLTKISLGFTSLAAVMELLYLLIIGAGEALFESLTVLVCLAVSAFASYIWVKAEGEFVWKVKSM